ncbi:hypothetical protein EB796_001317 [Bugula neritina]|uniref:Uncharacterized protein n=1 Tax=Bugula neritina TaxID=10212 RepID=A0A7J7KQG4_BUGNE|nr:hypothetical protein EB796_001317 [Bugula neritina]
MAREHEIPRNILSTVRIIEYVILCRPVSCVDVHSFSVLRGVCEGNPRGGFRSTIHHFGCHGRREWCYVIVITLQVVCISFQHQVVIWDILCS